MRRELPTDALLYQKLVNSNLDSERSRASKKYQMFAEEAERRARERDMRQFATPSPLRVNYEPLAQK